MLLFPRNLRTCCLPKERALLSRTMEHPQLVFKTQEGHHWENLIRPETMQRLLASCLLSHQVFGQLNHALVPKVWLQNELITPKLSRCCSESDTRVVSTWRKLPHGFPHFLRTPLPTRVFQTASYTRPNSTVRSESG